MGVGVFELGNPEGRGTQAVLEIQVDGGGGEGEGKKTVPSIVGVRIFSGITQYQAICNSLKVAEVKICSRVSHSKALPSILEIAEEFWP